jgi:hypothetical protein
VFLDIFIIVLRWFLSFVNLDQIGFAFISSLQFSVDFTAQTWIQPRLI